MVVGCFVKKSIGEVSIWFKKNLILNQLVFVTIEIISEPEVAEMVTITGIPDGTVGVYQGYIYGVYV